MMNRTRTGIALLILSHGLVGCGEHGSPSAPSAPQHRRFNNQVLNPTGIQPTVTAVAPHEGSTRGGAWATITGADFQPGATVRLGDSAVRPMCVTAPRFCFLRRLILLERWTWS